MSVTFLYSIDKEYENFRRSFSSRNHANVSPRQQEFSSLYPELSEENVRSFVERFIADRRLDIPAILQGIERQWRVVEKDFFRRADAIFRIPFSSEPMTAWLTIHDRCSYDEQKTEFFVHTNLPAANKTIMHELWHFYFFFSAGQDILRRHGRGAYNAMKEALTVLLNVEFTDLLKGVKDKGYPQHAALRERIAKEYEATGDVFEAIRRTLTTR